MYVKEYSTKNNIEIENIFRYCDLISSVYGLVALSSGASHLSSALKKYHPNLVSICIIEKMLRQLTLDKIVILEIMKL